MLCAQLLQCLVLTIVFIVKVATALRRFLVNLINEYIFYLHVSNRWSKGGIPISEANGDSLEVTVDHSYFTDPVSCEVSNSVGSTNVSTLVDVQCKYLSAKQTKLYWSAHLYNDIKMSLKSKDTF